MNSDLPKVGATYDAKETDAIFTKQLSERDDFSVGNYFHDYPENSSDVRPVQSPRHQQEFWNRFKEWCEKRKGLQEEKGKVGREGDERESEGFWSYKYLPYTGGVQSPAFFMAMPAMKEGSLSKVSFEMDKRILHFELGRYGNNVLAVQIFDAQDIPVSVLSVNIVDQIPEKGCFWLKSWSENTEIANFLIEEGLIELTGKTAKTGFALAYEARLTQKGLTASLRKEAFDSNPLSATFDFVNDELHITTTWKSNEFKNLGEAATLSRVMSILERKLPLTSSTLAKFKVLSIDLQGRVVSLVISPRS